MKQENITPYIKGIRVGDVEITYKGKLDPETYFWGAVKITRDGREFIWDVYQSYTDDLGDGYYRTSLGLAVDAETFADCRYDLTREDLLDPSSATLEYGGIDTSELEPAIELWFTDLEENDLELAYQTITLQKED